MYYELIKVRCRQGINIMNGGKPVLSDGHKIYSCSQKILDKGVVDLPLLNEMANRKLSYRDPDFMDDVYIYAVPDYGQNIIVNFHPISASKEVKGSYDHRGGNFINQIFVGDFEEFYPFELFGNDGTWDAKLREEAFYYENAPQPLPERTNLAETDGAILLDDIAQFVADGRRETVKAAIAFIIEQYRLPPEERKYLVIRDESSSYLELWIAAIESAFSPRMASGLPFATRMDKFIQTNRYTVNLNGVYQTQINLQDPKQKQRFRAMIVGVDERDKTNALDARPRPNEPYIILDGKSRTIDYTVDTSSAYYSLATSYTEQHVVFCREFLQMLDIRQPATDILKLHDAYTVLDNSFTNSPAQKIAVSLAVLETQRILPCAYLNRLYGVVKEALPRYLKEDLLSAFTILKWLQKAAPIAGDAHASKEFDLIIGKAFADCVYIDPRGNGTAKFWSSIRNSGFAAIAADYLVNSETFESYRGDIAKYNADTWIAFCQIYLSCAKKVNAYTVDGIYDITRSGIDICIQSGEPKKALEICGMMFGIDPQTSRDLLIRLTCEADDLKSKHYLWLLLNSDTGLVSTDRAAIDFVHFLQKQGQEGLCGYVMEYRAKMINQLSDLERYLDALLGDSAVRNSDLSRVYAALDSKLQLFDKSSVHMAIKLQETRNGKAVCPVSAHISALNTLSGKRNCNSMIDEFESYAKQGFPSINDEEYIGKLVKALLNCRLSEDEFDMIIGILVSSQLYIRTLSREIIRITTDRNSYAWNVLINTLSTGKDSETIVILANECVVAKKSEKQMNQLLNMLDSRKAQDYFSKVAGDVRLKKEMDAPRAGLKRLFGFGGRKK